MQRGHLARNHVKVFEQALCRRFKREDAGLACLTRAADMVAVERICFILRQMEYDADSYEIKLAGSETFAWAASLIGTTWEIKSKARPVDNSSNTAGSATSVTGGNLAVTLLALTVVLGTFARFQDDDEDGNDRTSPIKTARLIALLISRFPAQQWKVDPQRRND